MSNGDPHDGITEVPRYSNLHMCAAQLRMLSWIAIQPYMDSGAESVEAAMHRKVPGGLSIDSSCRVLHAALLDVTRRAASARRGL
jgi:hypothetical protein